MSPDADPSWPSDPATPPGGPQPAAPPPAPPPKIDDAPPVVRQWVDAGSAMHLLRDPDTTIESSQYSCTRCQYPLQGLRVRDNCPECGLLVSHSLLGNRLEFASPAFVKTLRTGAMLAFCGLIGEILTIMVTVFASAIAESGGFGPFGERSIELLASIVQMISTAVVLGGWWMLTAPDGSEPIGHAATLRRWIRALVIIGLVIALAQVIVSMLNLGGVQGQDIALLIVGVVGYLAMVARGTCQMVFLRGLARRVPSRGLESFLAVMIWLYPSLMTVGAILFCIGPLAAWIMYLIVVGMAATSLSQVVARQREAAAAALAGG